MSGEPWSAYLRHAAPGSALVKILQAQDEGNRVYRRELPDGRGRGNGATRHVGENACAATRAVSSSSGAAFGTGFSADIAGRNQGDERICEGWGSVSPGSQVVFPRDPPWIPGTSESLTRWGRLRHLWTTVDKLCDDKNKASMARAVHRHGSESSALTCR